MKHLDSPRVMCRTTCIWIFHFDSISTPNSAFWSAREKWNKINIPPKALMRFLSPFKSQRECQVLFTERLPQTNCGLSPRKPMSYEIQSWNRCSLIIFLFPSLQHIFYVCISVFRCQKDKHFQAQPWGRSLRRRLLILIIASAHFPVVNSSFHIFSKKFSLISAEWSCQEACPQPWLWPGFTSAGSAVGMESGAGSSGSAGKADPLLFPAEALFLGPFLASRAIPASAASLDLSLYLLHAPTPAPSSVWFTGSADPSLTWRHGQPCSVPPYLHPSPLRARASGACALGFECVLLCQNRRQQAFPTKGQRVNILE